jgi:hypothetical protein
MSKLLFLAVVVGLAISLVAQSQPPPPTPTITAQIKQDVSRVENTQSQFTNSPSQISPTAIDHPAANPTQKSTNANRQASQRATPFNWSRLNTALLTLFTGILAMVGFLQWRSMNKQAGYMRDGLTETGKAADAAKTSANAATKAAESALITEQAIVLVDSVTINTDELKYGSVVLFTLKNFGRTIAHSVEFTGRLHGLGQWPLDKTPPATIAPQGTNTWVTEYIGKWLGNDDSIQTINLRLSTLQYEIDVTYMDAFPEVASVSLRGEIRTRFEKIYYH